MADLSRALQPTGELIGETLSKLSAHVIQAVKNEKEESAAAKAKHQSAAAEASSKSTAVKQSGHKAKHQSVPAEASSKPSAVKAKHQSATAEASKQVAKRVVSVVPSIEITPPVGEHPVQDTTVAEPPREITSLGDAVLTRRKSFIPSSAVDFGINNSEQTKLARRKSLNLLEGMLSPSKTSRVDKGKGKAVEETTDINEMQPMTAFEMLSLERALAREDEERKHARRVQLNNAIISPQLAAAMGAHSPTKIAPSIRQAAPTMYTWAPGTYNANFNVDPTKPEYGWPILGGNENTVTREGEVTGGPVITEEARNWYEYMTSLVKVYCVDTVYRGVRGWEPVVKGYGNGQFQKELFTGYPIRHLLYNLALSEHVSAEEKLILLKYNRIYCTAIGFARDGNALSLGYLEFAHLDALCYDLQRIFCRPQLEADGKMAEYDLELPRRLANDKKEGKEEMEEALAGYAGKTSSEKLKEFAPVTCGLVDAMALAPGDGGVIPAKPIYPNGPPPKSREEKKAEKKAVKKAAKKAAKKGVAAPPQQLPPGFRVFKGGESSGGGGGVAGGG